MKKRYKELDALRGMAALLVVLFHYTMHIPGHVFGLKLGTTGVDLFFIISGFVILLSIENVHNCKQFAINRISRLYPTYWASVTLTFSAMLGLAIYLNDFADIDIPKYLANLSMFQFYLGFEDLDGPYWTMIIEMLFYIFIAGLFRFKLLKHLDTIFIGTSIITAIICHTIYHQYDWANQIITRIPLLPFLPLFHLGTVFYRFITKQIRTEKFYTLIAICFIFQMILFNYAGRTHYFIPLPAYAVVLIGYIGIFTLFVKGKLKFIINQPSIYLGKISFALYLIHQKISTAYIIPILEDKLHMNFWIAATIALIISIILASLITFFIEIPYSRKFKKGLYSFFNVQKFKRSRQVKDSTPEMEIVQ